MSKEDTQRELERLRKEVAALSAARRHREPEPPRKDQETPIASESPDAEKAIKGQAEEVIKLLEDEIRDMPAVTTLTVFVLGILMGRYLR